MFKLTFTIHGNPDRNQGDWQETHTLSAPTINDLRKSVLAFQGDNDIGGGNWGEATLTKDGKVVGRMSYNGRLWDGDDKEIIL